jgi:hypothetical protein
MLKQGADALAALAALVETAIDVHGTRLITKKMILSFDLGIDYR